MLQEVAVGACNHQSVCGRCCLRLRLCFANNRCSLCNMELKEVPQLDLAIKIICVLWKKLACTFPVSSPFVTLGLQDNLTVYKGQLHCN